MQQFILTIKRHGEEDRVKPYAYAKAAQDGFDTAVLRKGRLASHITLEEVTYEIGKVQMEETSRRVLRTWSRADLPTGPTVLYLLTDPNDEAIEVITEAHPSIQDVKLVPFPLAWDEDDEGNVTNYTTAERVGMMVADGLFASTHANHAFCLPDHNAELMVQFMAAYHRRYGRFPYVVNSDYTDGKGFTYTLVDLNKLGA